MGAISKSEKIFHILVAVYLIACVFSVAQWGNTGLISIPEYAQTVGVMTLFFAISYVIYLLLYSFYLLVKTRAKNAEEFILTTIKGIHADKEKNYRSLRLFVGFVLFFAAFAHIKNQIPYFNAFSWDMAFIALDNKLHFGNDPWALLHPALKLPAITALISFLYILWFPVIYGVIYWQLFLEKSRELQIQFFITFILLWGVLGTTMAIYFSSAGPAYVNILFGSNYYAALFEHLNAVNATFPIHALETQSFLWQNHIDKTGVSGTGISAFPSMHVATTFLIVLMTWNGAKLWRYTALVFFIAVLIGSVYTGWHYAVDGYISIILTFVIWKLTALLKNA